MTGDDDADGIMAYGIAYCLGRHVGDALLTGYYGGYVTVCNNCSVRDGLEDAPYCKTKRSVFKMDWWGEARTVACKINIKPTDGLNKDGQ